MILSVLGAVLVGMAGVAAVALFAEAVALAVLFYQTTHPQKTETKEEKK